MTAIKQLRYEFNSPEPLSLHEDVPTITFRGAFGYALAQVLARDETISEFSDKIDLYKAFFMTENTDPALSRNHNPSKPFVLRGYFSRPDLKSFILEVILLGVASEYESFFDKVIETIGYMGVGKRNAVCKCLKLSSRIVETDFPASHEILIDFITPTRLKSQDRIFSEEIPFSVLFARLYDRITEISSYYNDMTLNQDDEYAHHLKCLAANIASEKVNGGNYHVSRTSSRTGDQIRLDGFVGEMRYTGDFGPFAGTLKYLPWVHVGRFSVFGCGWTTIRCNSYRTSK